MTNMLFRHGVRPRWLREQDRRNTLGSQVEQVHRQIDSGVGQLHRQVDMVWLDQLQLMKRFGVTTVAFEQDERVGAVTAGG